MNMRDQSPADLMTNEEAAIASVIDLERSLHDEYLSRIDTFAVECDHVKSRLMQTRLELSAVINNDFPF